MNLKQAPPSRFIIAELSSQGTLATCPYLTLLWVSKRPQVPWSPQITN